MTAFSPGQSPPPVRIPILLGTRLPYSCGPKWRNWQTRRTQNPVSLGTCGFDSRLRHSRLLSVRLSLATWSARPDTFRPERGSAAESAFRNGESGDGGGVV